MEELDDSFNSIYSAEEPVEINEGVVLIQNVLGVNEKNTIINNTLHIVSCFGEGIIDIGYVFLPTGEQQISKFSGGKLILKQQRLYYIPINKKDISSDDFDCIKVPSDIADKFNVRYIKQGFACIEVIRHNSVIKNNETLCTLQKFINKAI